MAARKNAKKPAALKKRTPAGMLMSRAVKGLAAGSKLPARGLNQPNVSRQGHPGAYQSDKYST